MKTTYVTFDLVTIDGNQIIQNVNKVSSKKAGDNYVYNSDGTGMCLTEKQFEVFKEKL